METQLSLEGGVEHVLEYPLDGTNKNILDWITYGSEKEDSWIRMLNHFHDPTWPWESAGLRSWGMAGFNGLSGLLWAQKPNQDQGVLAVDGDYSWPDVRDYYFKAFTEAAKSTREENLGKVA